MSTKQLAATAVICTIAAISLVKLSKEKPSGNDPGDGDRILQERSTASVEKSGKAGETAAEKRAKSPEARVRTTTTGLVALKKPRLDEAGKKLLQEGPEQVLTAHAVGDGSQWTRADRDLLVAWAAQDPAAVLAWIHAADRNVSYADLLGGVATGILIKDGKKAMEHFLAEHQNDSELSTKDQGNLEKNLFYNLGRADTIDEAMEMLAGTNDGSLAGALIQGIEGSQNKISAMDGLEAKGVPVSPDYWSLQEDINEDPGFWTDWAWQRNSDMLNDTLSAWHRKNPGEAKRWIAERIPKNDPRRADIDELIQIREAPGPQNAPETGE